MKRFTILLIVILFSCVVMTGCSCKNVVGELMFTEIPIDSQKAFKEKT
jgi:hypothetical protein